MRGLPVILRLEGKRAVIVGGGAVAVRRAAALVEAGASVTVIAPQVASPLRTMPVGIESRAYRQGDLKAATLVVIATDDAAVNAQVAADAADAGVLVNRADQPEAGDVTIPAHAHHGPVTIAVHTGGISAAAAATIRRTLSEAMDPDWPTLLEAIAPYREQAQRRIADARQRQALLSDLASQAALAVLKAEGVEAVRRRCETLLTQKETVKHEV